MTTLKSLLLWLAAAPAALSAQQLTQPLPSNLWQQSEWISVVDAPIVTGRVEDGWRAADGANWFTTSFTNAKKVKKAVWMTTGLGVFDLFVNSKTVGNEILKPGFTHAEKTKIAYTYDITKLLNTKAQAENTIAAQVAPGWWADKIITPWGHEGMVGKKCAFRAVLLITYADGSTQTIATNTRDWRAGQTGPLKHAAIFDGEEYDARQKVDFSSFKAPEKNTEFNGEIVPTVGAEIYFRHDLALKPIEAYVWKTISGAKDGEFGTINIDRRYQPGQTMVVNPGENLVIDFGQNAAAVPQFSFTAKSGTKLHCLFSEILNDGNGARSRGMDGPEGSIHRENLRAHNTCFMLDYTFADAPQTFLPRNTFFGYRYVSITATDKVEISSILSVPVTSIAKNLETGKVTTGNDLINRLISNVYWGQLSNYLSVTTDCPQRNERLGWTADTQVFTETGTFLANTAPFFHKWMRDMRDSQGREGGFPGVAPFAQYGNEMTRVGWSDAGVICPWTIWKQFDDTRIVDESWASMEKYLDHITATKYDHNALISENGNYQWADWLSYEPLESCSGRGFENGQPKPEAVAYWNYLNASYWLIDAEMMRDMAAATGRDAEKYARIAQQAREYIMQNFLNADGTFRTEILNTMQTPALFALKNRLLAGEAKEKMIARLRENFRQHDNCLQTGFLGTSILMQTLTENSMADIAYELLFQRRNPSWLYSVDQGATTIWERWNSYMVDQGMGPQGMNSFNHYAYGCVCEWIFETCAGIQADTSKPGFQRIIMRPIPDRRLGHLEAEYRSAAGLIKSAWRYEGEKWIWKFTIPKGATALVTLPGETTAKEYTAGTYTVKK